MDNNLENIMIYFIQEREKGLVKVIKNVIYFYKLYYSVLFFF